MNPEINRAISHAPAGFILPSMVVVCDKINNRSGMFEPAK